MIDSLWSGLYFTNGIALVLLSANFFNQIPEPKTITLIVFLKLLFCFISTAVSFALAFHPIYQINAENKTKWQS